MRIIFVAAVLAASFAVSSAYAQSTYVHHDFCLRTASGQECAYDSMTQCEAAKRGNADFCMQNSAPTNHPPSQ